ncbi:hypothetical protein [Paenibacillus graminis]|uniref:Uncharacterized protein n=1 Tax=Paenibacillus graminis TaxID=189425 RepID=A0A089M507_9BACL|nr:hypothetical protein [Paenibacillus graminis]AIQ68861.1 hypothetical protein PGRAT_15460 [Paenibacillus graminis]MEC0166980.1 hypothetical protein [Paenibacillus graminis]
MESVEEGGLDLRWCRKANLKDGETKQLPGSSKPATLGSIMADFDTGKADQSLGGKIADGAKLRASNAKMWFNRRGNHCRPFDDYESHHTVPASRCD